MNYHKTKETRKSEYSSFGNNQFTNIFTGDQVSPTILDMDNGGKNINNVGINKGDTGIINKVLTGKKIELCKSITFPVSKKMVDISEVYNLDMKDEYIDSPELPEDFIQYLSTDTLYKIIELQTKNESTL